jgi:hypothetical protein
MEMRARCSKVWSTLNGDELHNFEHKRIVRSADFAQVCDWRLHFAWQLLRLAHTF